MTRRQRLVNLGIAAVIAVAAVVIILATSGSDESEPESAATPAPTVEAPPTPGETVTPAPTPTPKPKPEIPAIKVKDGEVVGGVKTIKVDEGDRARFTITSDVAEEVHVHAYDIYKDLEPGKPGKFSFDATITGIIEVELHGSGLPVAELRVEP